MISWKVGDLGRFEVEDKKRPRFEVLGTKPNRGIAVWYGGSANPVFIPVDTFRERCVKSWTLETVPVPTPPDWAVPKASFQILHERAARLTQAVITSGYQRQESQVEVTGHTLRIRRIQYDYASCFDEQAKILVMVPLKIIIEYGRQVRTILDRLMGDDLFDDEEHPPDEIDRLLTGA